jgi:RNA polymerase sigma-70 factor (ECF subfamily)
MTIVAASVEERHEPGERLAALFEIHHARLFRLACRLTADREEARDLVQETFLRALRSSRRKGGLPPAGAAPGEAWLVRTLVNLCRDRYRRLAVRRRPAALAATAGAAITAATNAASAANAPGGSEEALVARATVRAALARLSPRRRAVVVLHELEELPVGAVARLLGIAEVTVRWHLLMARRELARVLLAPVSGAAAAAQGDRK